MFDLKIGNTKNLPELLQLRLEIKYAGEVVYDNSNKSIFKIFKDKWLSKSERDDLVKYDIGSQNW